MTNTNSVINLRVGRGFIPYLFHQVAVPLNNSRPTEQSQVTLACKPLSLGSQQIEEDQKSYQVSDIKILVDSYSNQIGELVHHSYTWIATNIRALFRSCFTLRDLIYFYNQSRAHKYMIKHTLFIRKITQNNPIFTRFSYNNPSY